MTNVRPPIDIVADLWQLVGADAAALDDLKLSGVDPVLPSSFRVGTAAQASIAAAALAAAELRHCAGAPRQHVSVDMRHAAIEFRSEHYLTINGEAPATYSDPLFRAYRAGDGRFVRLHMNFPHHRDAVLELLGCAPTREAIEARSANGTPSPSRLRLTSTAVLSPRCASPDEWAQHPQAAAIAADAGGADREDRRSAGTAAAARPAAAVRSSRP